MADGNIQTRVIHVEVENELRILTDDEDTTIVSIELESGLAEIFGAEMALNKVYRFPPNSYIGIFTWYGCTIKITGKVKSTSIVKDTLMMLNVILHAYLEERRNLAALENIRGPVTLIVGPTDVGKSTLCRFLLNYAARLGKQPLYVDLDVDQNSISLPGTVGVVSVENPADIEGGYEVKAAKIYHYGYKSPVHDLVLYFLLLKHLGEVIKLGLSHANSTVTSSGIIINTCGWIRDQGYNAITYAALAFEVDAIFVVGEELLYTKLKQDIPANVEVYYMPEFDGVVRSSHLVRARARVAKTAEYFYGSLYQLRPTTFDMKLNDVVILKVVRKPVNEGFDFANATFDNIEIERTHNYAEILNKVLAVLKLGGGLSDVKIALTEVVGFVCVKRVYGDKITFLSPQPPPLPNNIFLSGDIGEYNELMDIKPIM